jgi:hypothetical protein
MKAITLSFLALISVASCAFNTPVNNQQVVQHQPQQVAVPSTPDVSTYTHDQGNRHSQLLLAPKKVRASTRVVHDDPDRHIHSVRYSSSYYYNSQGVEPEDVREVARNLDKDFVDTALAEHDKENQNQNKKSKN